MSNRPRLTPPPAVAAAARAYTCGHCHATKGRPRRDRDGTWHLDVRHDASCPVLTGTVSPASAGLAAAAAAAAPGKRALYIGQAGGAVRVTVVSNRNT